MITSEERDALVAKGRSDLRAGIANAVSAYRSELIAAGKPAASVHREIAAYEAQLSDFLTEKDREIAEIVDRAIGRPAQITHADATMALSRKIVAKFGDVFEAVDDLEFGVHPCRHEGNERRGFVLTATPGASGATPDNMLWAYFGDALSLPQSTLETGLSK